MSMILDRIVAADARRVASIESLERKAFDSRRGSLSAAWAGEEDLASRLAALDALSSREVLRQLGEMGTLTLAVLGDDGRVFVRPDGQILAIKNGVPCWAMPWSADREREIASRVMALEVEPSFDWRCADPACIKPH